MHTKISGNTDKENHSDNLLQKKNAAALTLPAVPALQRTEALQLKEEPGSIKPVQLEEDEETIPEAVQEEQPGEAEEEPIDDNLAELLSYATEAELDAIIGTGDAAEESGGEVKDDGTPATTTAQPAQLTKQTPKNPGNYTATAVHGGRTYHHKFDGISKRTTKFSGPLTYVQGGRKNTPKVAYKRKNDAAGHLIAHSFGGPPQFTGNFVAMNKLINSAGGAWGQMEFYIRKRLKAANTTAYMSVTPNYPNAKSKRPNSISVTAHFNRDPKKKKWTIATL
jgi:hypothetical protein